MRKNWRYGALWRVAAALAVAGAMAVPAAAQTRPAETRPSLNLYAVTGLIDMPSGEMQPDGEFSIAAGGFGRFSRTAISYQLAPWLQGAFRYTGVAGLRLAGFGPNDIYYDRSFDVRFRILREGTWRPSVVVGLQDFIGTGNFNAEYIVATKHLTPRFKVTGGLGWGRFGSQNPIFSIGTRPRPSTATGGTVNFGQWFRGNVALFGGVEWQPTDRLNLKLEYSSDAYVLEDARQNLFRRQTQLNFGAEYDVARGVQLGAYYMYGQGLGVSLQIALNSRERAGGAFLYDPAALPVAVRPSRASAPSAWDQSWASAPGAAVSLRAPLAQALAAEGLVLESLAVGATQADLRIRNLRYDVVTQAVGRAARVMARLLPASVETFVIVPVTAGVPTVAVTLQRSDLESLEFAPDAAAALRARVSVADAGPAPAGSVRGEGLYPRFDWGLEPYLSTGLFDPDNPYRFDVGLRLRASYSVVPGLVLAGAVTQRLFGTLADANRPSNSVLPRVRSNVNRYNDTSTALERLTVAWYARPGENLYSRVTVGYLERMYGGVSAELLWRPVDSRLALGAELSVVRQRAFDGGFGFRNLDAVTGHVSAYYAFRQGYTAQVDVGRYLAGDYGATFTLEREFANGWRVGAFATLTNVPFADFGEGSFDKGIMFTIPISAIIGRSTRSASSAVIRPLQRDGGAKLIVDGRLYPLLRDTRGATIDASFGRVWR